MSAKVAKAHRDNPALGEAKSERMAKANPMQRAEVRDAMRTTLKRIGHKPKVRGGAGKGLTRPQAALLKALGPGWQAEHVVPTGGAKGLPKHYRIDLAHPGRKVAVEVDGGSHGARSRKAQDRRKDRFLQSLGWIVYRVPNETALKNTPAVVKAIDSLG